MRKQKRTIDWSAWQETINGNANVLIPFREYVSEYFDFESSQDELGLEFGYTRRPLIGLRLELEDGKVLAVRPGWTPPRKRTAYTTVPTETTLPKQRVVTITEPGQIDINIITLELLGPGKLMQMELEGDQVKNSGALFFDMDKNRRHLSLIVQAVHGLLMDPTATFANQREHCVRCGKKLSDLVSRTRGVGPECIAYFTYWDTAKITAVDKYRQQYLQDTGFLPGR